MNVPNSKVFCIASCNTKIAHVDRTDKIISRKKNTDKYKERSGGSYHDCPLTRRIAATVMPRAMAKTVRTMSAMRHLHAHFFSAFRRWAIKACFSASVFSGNHAAGSADGARRGERRIKAPSIQKGGNKKPNLKRYMASVTGSAFRVYSGGLTYGGGSIWLSEIEIRRSC